MTWRSLNILISTVLVLGGASYAVAINRSASDAIFFSSAGIGPAYFPNILAVLLVALSVITLVKNLRDPSPELASKVTTVNSIYIVATLVLRPPRSPPGSSRAISIQSYSSCWLC